VWAVTGGDAQGRTCNARDAPPQRARPGGAALRRSRGANAPSHVGLACCLALLRMPLLGRGGRGVGAAPRASPRLTRPRWPEPKVFGGGGPGLPRLPGGDVRARPCLFRREPHDDDASREHRG
jgi:hypothetical protein